MNGRNCHHSTVECAIIQCNDKSTPLTHQQSVSQSACLRLIVYCHTPSTYMFVVMSSGHVPWHPLPTLALHGAHRLPSSETSRYSYQYKLLKSSRNRCMRRIPSFCFFLSADFSSGRSGATAFPLYLHGYNSACMRDMSKILASIRGFSGSGYLTMSVKFYRDRPWLPWQRNWS